MGMQKVSIIIPVYNHAQWLPDAISSALNQTVPCEVIVVNDGSPDNTSEVAKMFDVKLIEKENGGLSSARNAGIKEATGEWILTLDADDKIAPDFVEKCLQIHRYQQLGKPRQTAIRGTFIADRRQDLSGGHGKQG